MNMPCEIDISDFELSFKVFHRLMANKVHEILLVSSPYDAFIMEEDGRLAETDHPRIPGLEPIQPAHAHLGVQLPGGAMRRFRPNPTIL